MAQQYRHESSRYSRYVQEESCSEESIESGSEDEEEVEEVISHGHGLTSSSAPQSSHYQQRYEYESYGGNMNAPKPPLSFEPNYRFREEKNYYTHRYEQPLYGGKPKMEIFDQERGHGAYENHHEKYISTVNNNHDSYSFGDNFERKFGSIDPPCISHGRNREGIVNETSYYSNFNDKDKFNQAHNNYQPRPMSAISNTTSMTTSAFQSKEPLGKSNLITARSPYARDLDLRSRFNRLGAY